MDARHGLRDCVEALDSALEAARVEGLLWTQPGVISRMDGGTLNLAAEILTDTWNRQVVGDRRRFDHLTLPAKMGQLQSRYSIARPPFTDEILSINVARNCLTHRRGIVGPGDVDPGTDFMTVRWRRWRLTATADGVRTELKIGSHIEKESLVTIQLVPRSRRFRLGRPISISAADYVEIATTFTLFGNQLQSNIISMQEARYQAQIEGS